MNEYADSNIINGNKIAVFLKRYLLIIPPSYDISIVKLNYGRHRICDPVILVKLFDISFCCDRVYLSH